MPHLAVIGAGPAGLMAAETAAAAGARVSVFDQMAAPGRKFLMAGRGGLNLTHAEPLEAQLARYRPPAPALLAALRRFPPAALIAWCEGLGEPTFIGSSQRVFPRSLKASPLLRAWLRRLAAAGVALRLRHRLVGIEGAACRFATPEGESREGFDAVILALGGASWPRLGSDGAWPALLPGIALAPFAPSNAGVEVAWSARLRALAGTPLKRIALTHAGVRRRGEAVVTGRGLEGGAVYALSAPIREALARDGAAPLLLDLRPDLPLAALRARLAARGRGETLSARLRKGLGLPPVAIALVHEARLAGGAAADVAALVKALPLTVRAMAGLDRAISSAGGVCWDEVDGRFMLRARPGLFVAGEMLDWEAPTGGYLLQACFATGVAAAEGALAWLTAGSPPAA